MWGPQAGRCQGTTLAKDGPVSRNSSNFVLKARSLPLGALRANFYGLGHGTCWRHLEGPSLESCTHYFFNISLKIIKVSMLAL